MNQQGDAANLARDEHVPFTAPHPVAVVPEHGQQHQGSME